MRLSLKGISLVLCLLAAVGGGAWWSHRWLVSSVMVGVSEKQYNLLPGTTLAKLAADLAKEQIITHPRLFVLYAKINSVEARLKAGTYVFRPTDSPKTIVDMLLRGEVFTLKFTIPEGWNMFQIARRLAFLFPKTDEQQWLHAMQDTTLLEIVYTDGLHNEPASLEGYLFPQTYLLNPNATPRQVIREFVQEFRRNVSPALFAEAHKKLGLTASEFVTLASIVEKETANPTERGIVAAVYLNRLRLKMRLQADPTVIYALGQNYKGELTKADLRKQSPYNTYVVFGLPPGPIANPGLASLRATLRPAESNALYFVAKGDGSHVFSDTLPEHNRAVKQYLRFLEHEKQKERGDEKLLRGPGQ